MARADLGGVAVLRALLLGAGEDGVEDAVGVDPAGAVGQLDLVVPAQASEASAKKVFVSGERKEGVY